MASTHNGYVTIRLGEAVREQLEELAREGERSLSAQIRLAIREHLEREKVAA